MSMLLTEIYIIFGIFVALFSTKSIDQDRIEDVPIFCITMTLVTLFWPILFLIYIFRKYEANK